MPDLEISNLPAIAEAAVQGTDPLAIADLSASETKKVTVKDLVAAGVALIDDADIPAAKVAGPFAANTVATATIQNDAVNADKLATDSVTADAIAANAVGASELADNAVDSAAIATNAVITAKITDLNVTADKLASNSVTTVKILDGNVTYAKLNLSNGDIPGVKIASGGITATQLATDSVTATELADDAVDTNAIANLAVTGGKIAATTVTGSNLVNNTITATQLADNTITATQIAANAVGASELADDAVDTDAIVDGAVTGAKLGSASIAYAKLSIADGDIPGAKLTSASVTATQIANTTITGAKLVNDTITATQIAANAITASELADNAVDEAAIASNAVTVNKIANTTVTYAKLNLSDGDIPAAKLVANSLTAGQIAADAIGASELANDAVDTAAIADGAVTGAKIANTTIAAGNIVNNTITATQLANNAVGSAQIADGAVTAAKLSGTLAAASIADDAVTTAKIADDAVDSTKLAANAVDAAALADNAVDSGAIATGAVIEAKLAANAVVNAKIADGTITAAKLNTTNIDRSLNVASGNLGINNAITAATRSGITYNAQGLITGTVALAAADLPVATASAVGGVSVGTGLSVSGAGALSLTNSVTGGASTVSGITFNAQGMITAATALTAANLPIATTSAKGAVLITSGGGLTVDGSGGLTTSTSGISAGTYQSITVNNKGVATAGAALTAALIPDLAASKITSGSIDAARIGADSIDGTKLSNSSTALFQSVQQTGTYPTAQYNGQLLFDTVTEDCFIWDGNAWQAITTLTKGSLVFGGTFNATTSKMVSTTSAGIAAGLAVGSNLPTASATTDGVYVVVSTSGTPSSPAPVVALAPPDYILGVTNSAGSSWNEIDLSQTVAGQVASNITFTPYGQISSTNVQDALQELETEKLALAGGTVTGQILIGNAGSLVFEGATADAYETKLAVVDPTTSDKTLLLPNENGTLISSGGTGTVTGTMIANDTIQNVDIKSDAAIAYSKLQALPDGQILIGSSGTVATPRAVTGDISINNAGLTAIASGVIVDGDISGSAAITGSKIATGTTSAVGVLQLTNAVDSASATTACTPAAVKTVNDALTTTTATANAALPKVGGTMTGNLIIDNAKEIRFSEADSNGANYLALKAPASVTADITWTLPDGDGSANQFLKTDGSGNLSWATDSATDSTKMPLAGGTFTGDVTFTGDASNGLWDKSASAFVADLTGTASIATSITVADESTDTTCFPLFATAATGNLGAKSGTNLTFNSSSGALTATSFVGALTGNADTATALATARTIGGTSFDGSANIAVALSATATALATARTINGTSFDGTGDITVTAAAGTLTGTELKSTVVTSSLTSVGTLTGLTVDGDVTFTGASSNGSWDKSANAFVGNLTGTASNNAVLTGSTNNTIATVTGANALTGEANLTFNGSGDLTVKGNDNVSANLYLIADLGEHDGDGWRVGSNQDANDLTFANNTSGSYVDKLTLQNDGDLYTTSDVYLKDGKRLILGDASDVNIKHQSGHFEINNSTGNTYFQSNGEFRLRGNHSGSTEEMLKAVAGGAVTLYYDNTATLATTTSGVTVTGAVSDSKGNLRSIPSNAQSSAYVAVAADAGKAIYISTGGVTINNSVFSAGDAVTIINNSGSDQTITKGSGVTLYNTADATDANRTLAQRGMATIWFAAADTAYISGAGLS